MWKSLEKIKLNCLVTSQFSFPEVDGMIQNTETLVQDAPCKTFLTLSGDKKPDERKLSLVSRIRKNSAKFDIKPQDVGFTKLQINSNKI